MCKILRKFDIKSLYICPPHLYTVATLPWETQKSTELFTHTSDYLHYLRRKTVTSYPPHLKNVTVLPWKNAQLFHLTEGMLHSSKRWWLWQKPVVMCSKWNVRQATLQHGYMLPVFFVTDQLHCPPRSTEIQPKSQQDASATRPYYGLVLDTHEKMKKMKNVCILQGSVVTLFRRGG